MTLWRNSSVWGQVNGKRYFKCAPGRGIMVKRRSTNLFFDYLGHKLLLWREICLSLCRDDSIGILAGTANLLQKQNFIEGMIVNVDPVWQPEEMFLYSLGHDRCDSNSKSEVWVNEVGIVGRLAQNGANTLSIPSTSSGGTPRQKVCFFWVFRNTALKFEVIPAISSLTTSETDHAGKNCEESVPWGNLQEGGLCRCSLQSPKHRITL